MSDKQSQRDAVDDLLADWAGQGVGADPDALGVVLRVQALARWFDERVTERLGDFGLTWWQYDVLSALRRQGPPYALGATELAEAGALSTGALTTRIDRLVEQALVERRRGDEDRRRVEVRLTVAGLELIDRAVLARFEVAESCLAGLSATNRRRVNGLLRQLLATA